MTLHLKHKGAGEIKASDFDSNSDIEILNPELHICTCDDDANFDLELLIGRGRGYVPNNLNKEKLPSADFSILALYTKLHCQFLDPEDLP